MAGAPQRSDQRGFDPGSAAARRESWLRLLTPGRVLASGVLIGALGVVLYDNYPRALWPEAPSVPAAPAPPAQPLPASVPGLPATEPADPVAETPAVEEPPVLPSGETRPPRLLARVAPQYPRLAREARMSGVVVLRAEIGEDGTVRSAQAEERSNPVLAEAALAAVRQWRYEPALLRGQAVTSDVTVRVNFALDGSR